MDMSNYLDMFIDESEEHIESLSQDMLIFEKSPENIDIIQKMFRSAHTLKGMAGSMGFSNIQNLTHKMENFMDDIRNGKLNPSEAFFDFMFEGVDLLEKLLNEIKENGSELSSIEQVLKKEISNEVKNTERKTNIFSLSEIERSALDEAKEQNLNVFLVHLELNEDCILKYVRTNMFFTEITKIGEIFKMDKTEEHIEHDEDYDGSLNLIFISEKNKELIESLENKISEIKSVKVSDFKFKEEAYTEPKQGDNSKETKEDLQRVEQRAQSIRVDLNKIDSLLSLFEELVVERGRLADIAARLEDPDLDESLLRLSRNSSQLQSDLLSLRMVPVNMIFSRFPRMVRNLSREVKKDIEFVIEGEMTELDRTIVDELGDPLVHLLRNSLDHGIEFPEDRLKKGKSKTGTIKLSAYRKGNDAFIEVKDDGGGISANIIKEKLIANKILEEQEANSLSDQDIIQYIFSSGLSTAKKVTDISGRGVGLDAVRSKVEELGGSVSVYSEKDIGTTFTIRIPLTLSIIQALNVQDESITFLLPLSAVNEIISLNSHMIQNILSERVLQHRDKLFEIRCFSSLYGLETQVNKKKYALIVQGESESYALLVDDIYGESEIVLKPLVGYLEKIEGVIGATILGNGSVAFVLDVNFLN